MGRHTAVAELTNVHVHAAGAHILRDVSMQVAKGERLLVTGPSGSGKSTLLRTLAGLDTPSQGNVHVLGRSLSGLGERARRKHIQGRVGIGFQSANLDSDLSVLDNLVTLPNAFGSRRQTVRRAGELAARLGVADKLLQPAATLSGGEKLRVSLGRLLVPHPELLLLDEPTSMVDPKGKAEVFQAIDELAGPEATIIMVSHDEEAASIATRQIEVVSGSIIAPLHLPISNRVQNT